jgi:hypothetical protein
MLLRKVDDAFVSVVIAGSGRSSAMNGNSGYIQNIVILNLGMIKVLGMI